MQEFTAPSITTVDENATTITALQRYRKDRPTLPLFRRRADSGQWITVTAGAFADDVDAVAKGLIAAGVSRGDRVALLSSTRFEWSLIDYAIWRAGATTVAIYETSSPDQVEWILTDSGASILIVETAANRSTHQEVIAKAPELRETFVIDDGAINALRKRGADLPDSVLDERESQARASDAATLIYTSGTTGRPKGVVLTHENFLAECAATAEAVGTGLEEGKSTLLFLPLAHVFARVVAVGCVENAVVLGHTNDIPNLIADLAVFKPNYVLSVPRVFEKVYNTAEQKAIDGGKGKIFAKAVDTAIEYSRAVESGDAGVLLKVKHAVFDKLVYGKLRAALGGNCEGAISGGAPLGERLGHFFRGAGVPVYEGYGLSETTAAVTANNEEHSRIGSVGRPVPGVTVKIADDGEILLKGPMVFSGYWRNEQATADAIRDGWFHTGDIGRLEDGYLFITGRKKELIVTAGGKNVSPAQLEDTIRAHPLVSQCLVVGDQKPFIAALVTLDPEAVPGWLERKGLPASTPLSELIRNPELRAEIDAAIAGANKTVSKAEAIKKYEILETDFTIETGELTPTLKLKRNVIHQSYQEAIADLYS
ncbi:long-chain fatty acid--CoA ligase [Gordonia sp. PS3]|uniref:Acyl-CoA synthetase n=1 Tax=Gordonia sihwensis NBRC 108236 TaxID=1223544 RepID=L7LRZ7_9ACTN|nr:MULTISPECIES: AMP-dependent synthetase/ligase [Gordonia]AUH69427.1 long-chain fatty acid--CoA ligase [Gordonia sp. YC-JH1]KJR10073.1 long-chain fatty acid--CoA ligase [Gordonia sihwensis]MBY4570609.1 long-chain fatty acid--CoA ligase [Gordonia sihwensis]WFN94121.1 AMP-dependent synthetase/ligase [Gordonia sihwensis]GAC62818.1 long-chain fatty-acid--CoA ligase FadD [Gordonia sihwensis NBRC 108236]